MTEKCLITGASGFIGRWLCSTLLESGHDVRCFDSKSAGVEDEILGDILDSHALEKACAGVQAVCHLAALQSSHQYSWKDYYAANVTGTESLLKACIRHNVKHIVFFSTELVYGHQVTSTIGEDATLKPCGFYGRSKMMAEELCGHYARKGLQVTIVRPCNIMGPGKTRVVDQLFDRINNHAFIPLVGGKQKPCQFIDVRDVAEITTQILESQILGIFNLGSSHPPSAAEVYSKLIHHANSHSKLISVPAGLFRSGFRILDVLKLSPLTSDQYYRLSDSWIVDSSKLFGQLKHSLKYDEVRSLIDTYDAYCTTPHRPASAP